MQPTVGAEDELGVEGEARGQGETTGFGDLAQAIAIRPRPLGVDMVEGQGRYAAPVVDTRVEQDTEVVAEVGWRLQVNLRRQHQPRRGDRPQQLVLRAGLFVLHPRAWLGQEVLHDDLLDVPVATVGVSDRFQCGQAVGPRLADADEDAGGEGDARPSRGFEGFQPARRRLVGRTPVAREVVAQGLHHHPLARRNVGQHGQLFLAQCPGVGVGQQPGLGEHQIRHRVQEVDRAVVAVGPQPAPGHLISFLGRLAQGEQGLMAARPGTVAGDLQHFLG